MHDRPAILDVATQSRPPQQRRSRDKRARLHAAALALFAERGYAMTSIDDLASRAGLAVGTVYQHVRSKRDLLLTLMDDLLSHLEFAFRPSRDRHTSIRRLFDHALQIDGPHGGVPRAWQEAVATDREVAQKDAAIHAWMIDRIHQVLAVLEK